MHTQQKLICFGLLSLACSSVMAAPYNGQSFRLMQPDSSRVEVKVFGDEYAQIIESPEGYTLVRSPSGWIEYATLATTGELQASGMRYQANGLPQPSLKLGGLTPKLRPSAQALLAERKANAAKLHAHSPQYTLPFEESKNAPAFAPVNGNVVGLTILIEFPDVKSAVPSAEIEKMLNLKGYKGYRNYGSVRDYFGAVSNGKVDYTQKVATYTAKNPKSYYDCATCQKAQELILEALNSLKNSGFNFSELTNLGGQWALNAMYAGEPDWGWAKGLWPHMSTMNSNFNVNGVYARKYQITNIGTELTVGTFVHENGHMLCNLPDLYSYDNHGDPVDGWDLMSLGMHANNGKQPVGMNPYFRKQLGWIPVQDISTAPKGTGYAADIATGKAYTYGGSPDGSAKEFFYIETRRKKNWDAYLPGEGLVIWHIDENGDNTVASAKDEVTPMGAYTGALKAFNAGTNPPAIWHNGVRSKIEFLSQSNLGDEMIFSIGTMTQLSSSSNLSSSSALSSTLSSSSRMSSSNLSSVVLSSSSQILSSSSAQNNDCSEYPAWKSNITYQPGQSSTADWLYSTEVGAGVQHKNAVYGTWWASAGAEPGVHSSWAKVRDCQQSLSSSARLSSSTLSSSSSFLQSSSSQKLSSSSGVITLLTQKPQQPALKGLSADWIEVKAPWASLQVLNSQGQALSLQSHWTADGIALDLNQIPTGVWTLQVQSGGNVWNYRIVKD
jgi:M6 family metalloprotease-like protein